MQECFDEDTYDVHETTASEEGPAMMVSIGNRQQFLTLTDLSRMSATSFSTLWAVRQAHARNAMYTIHVPHATVDAIQTFVCSMCANISVQHMLGTNLSMLSSNVLLCHIASNSCAR